MHINETLKCKYARFIQKANFHPQSLANICKRQQDFHVRLKLFSCMNSAKRLQNQVPTLCSIALNNS